LLHLILHSPHAGFQHDRLPAVFEVIPSGVSYLGDGLQ